MGRHFETVGLIQFQRDTRGRIRLTLFGGDNLGRLLKRNIHGGEGIDDAPAQEQGHDEGDQSLGLHVARLVGGVFV
jgi:hypothetical protein